MLRDRVLSGVIGGPVMLALIVVGGHWFIITVLLILGVTLIEFNHLVARQGHRAFAGLMLLWLGLFAADRILPEVGLLAPGMALLIFLSLGWALVRFQQGTVNAMTGFAMTLTGGLYFGWGGTHLISLRALDDGLFWTLTVVLAVWISDTAAYLIGKVFGRRRMCPAISPHKTWEGYLGGVFFGILLTATLMLLWQRLGANLAVLPVHGAIIGALASFLGPLGDFGMSMIKRYTGVKDSSRLIPGHGGFLDRTDALLVTTILGYYYVTLFVL